MITCPIEPSQFGQLCRAPVAGGYWNSWLLLRTTADDPSDEEIAAEIPSVMDRWLPGGDKFPGHDHLSSMVLRRLEDSPDTAVLRRRADCPVFMSLRGGGPAPGYRFVVVRFVARTQRASIPWPVLGSNSPLVGAYCPRQADWLADRIYTFDGRDVPPAEPRPGTAERVGRAVADGLAALYRGASAAAAETGWGYVALGAALAVGAVVAVRELR